MQNCDLGSPMQDQHGWNPVGTERSSTDRFSNRVSKRRGSKFSHMLLAGEAELSNRVRRWPPCMGKVKPGRQAQVELRCSHLKPWDNFCLRRDVPIRGRRGWEFLICCRLRKPRRATKREYAGKLTSGPELGQARGPGARKRDNKQGA
jgi:hypothetical protein